MTLCTCIHHTYLIHTRLLLNDVIVNKTSLLLKSSFPTGYACYNPQTHSDRAQRATTWHDIVIITKYGQVFVIPYWFHISQC